MNNPNAHDSYWLEYSETLDEIKEESVEIKEELFDDMVDFKQEDLVDYFSDFVKDEIEDIKEDFEDFADIKEEEPIIDGINAIGNESVDIKEEPIDGLLDIKEEDLYTLPIADVFCPSTGDSRPLNINFEELIHSNKIAPPRPTKMNATNTIPSKASVGVARDEVVKLGRIRPPIGSPTPIATTFASIASNRYSVFTGLLKKCAFCDARHAIGADMERHVLWMHPEAIERCRDSYAPMSSACQPNPLKCVKSRKCSYCDAVYTTGAEMENHVRSMHPEELEKIRQRTRMKVCSYCNYLCAIGREMANHVNLMHPYAIMRRSCCTFCGEVYIVGADMENHVRSMHPEQCTILKNSSNDAISEVAQKHRERRPKDEQLAVDNGLPISAAEIVDMPRTEFKKLLKSDSLTESQRELIWKIRKRGQKRLYARKKGLRRRLERTVHVISNENDQFIGIVD